MVSAAAAREMKAVLDSADRLAWVASTGLAGAFLWQSWLLARALRHGRAAEQEARTFTQDEDESHDRKDDDRDVTVARPSRPSRPLPLAAGTRSVLVVGDSTGLGVGATRPSESVAGLLAAEHPQVGVTNVAIGGDRMSDALAVARRLRRDGHGGFDVALLMIGGNDVLRATRLAPLRRDADRLLAELAVLSRRTVWLGPANIGLSPTFVPPFSWWLSDRGRSSRDVFARAAAQAGAYFVDFFAEVGTDPFSADPGRYYAADRVHPSSASYRHCYRALKLAVPLQRWLAIDRAEGRAALHAPLGMAVASGAHDRRTLVDETRSRADALKRNVELQHITGRGRPLHNQETSTP